MEDKILSERIDRNGTKHQLVLMKCDRCGGAGGLERWRFTGKTCYKCGGTGKMEKKRKLYTPEHEAKLEKRREQRRMKKEEEIRAGSGERNKEYLRNVGYSGEKIYVVAGDTYHNKEKLKEEGARFNRQIMGWFFTERTGKWDTYELETKKLIEYDDLNQVFISYSEEAMDYIHQVKTEKRKQEPQSNYVGAVGDKVELQLEVLKTIEFYYENNYSYGTSTVFINRMRDDEGNIFIWKTGSKNLEHHTDDNSRVKIRGTIKEHNKYKEEKQTVLTRCRVVTN